MQKKKKIVFIVSLFIVILLSMSNCIFADNFSTSSFENISGADNGVANTTAKNVMGIAINVIRIVGTGVAIIMLSYMAIKYMMSAPNEKAEFKKSMSIFVVGAILVFASSQILALIFNFAGQNIKAS